MVDICSNCHPFYTGKQKFLDTGGRIERFNKKYGQRPPTTPANANRRGGVACRTATAMLDDLLLGKLSAVESRFEELTRKLSDPDVLAQPQLMQKLAKEHSDLRELVDTYRVHRDVVRRMGEAREMQKDPEMRDLARAEESELAAESWDGWRSA